MKLVRRDLVHGGPGSVKIISEEDDDMWHVYNLIFVGDSVQAVIVRKVIRDLAHGGWDTECVKLKLEIKVESFSKTNGMIRRHDLFDDSMVAAGMSGVETGTKQDHSNSAKVR
ncbi:protein PELOTA 1 isoform X3 [Canna indica]|uniref:Protein PELOTA 1 isoform X3 n=1 Tax=Canna indica TaxID=4628 RepID=A0AAQ3Q520_9LILI|nr:protein PELOTA 1 isoform X3 [Canna indica]